MKQTELHHCIPNNNPQIDQTLLKMPPRRIAAASRPVSNAFSGGNRHHAAQKFNPILIICATKVVVVGCVGLWLLYTLSLVVREISRPNQTAHQHSRNEYKFPYFELPELTNYDAYGIRNYLMSTQDQIKDPPLWYQQFTQQANDLRTTFALRYGNENMARMMLTRGISTFHRSTWSSDSRIPSNVQYTARRVLEVCKVRKSSSSTAGNATATSNGEFRISFGGYSVTVGRGNYFLQSFPFVLERLLQPIFETLNITLSVRNAAIGGIPSFPYGFCMTNFWGQNVDVVSWDYSMNEAGGMIGGIEAYIRHLVNIPMNKKNPMLLVKDTHMATERRELIQNYVNEGVMYDPIVVHTDPAVDLFFKGVPEDHFPIGFTDWRVFGSPPGAPGQALHHPALKEHELIGWMIAMHFLASLELAAAELLKVEGTSSSYLLDDPQLEMHPAIQLPKPKGHVGANSVVSSLFFGVPSTSDGNVWMMNPIYCRTTFDPVVHGTLQDIVVSGTAGDGIDLMFPKGAMYYNSGWVLDYGEGEKKAKQKLQKYDSLGYIDSKKAYYGVNASGNLTLFVPCIDSATKHEATEVQENNQSSERIKEGDDAFKWFTSFVVCEVNEKRGEKECNIETDLTFVVGGVMATGVSLVEAEGASHLGKKLCVSFEVPMGSKISRVESPSLRHGLEMNIAVNNVYVSVNDGACSVSHLIWEQKALPDRSS